MRALWVILIDCVKAVKETRLILSLRDKNVASRAVAYAHARMKLAYALVSGLATF